MSGLNNIIYALALGSYLASMSLFSIDFYENLEVLSKWGVRFLRVGFALVVLMIGLRGVETMYFPVYTFYETLLLFVALSTLTLLFLHKSQRFKRPFFYTVPLIFLFFLMAGVVPADMLEINPEMTSPWLVIHIIAVIAAYATLALAFCSALVYLFVDYYLKKRKTGSLLGKLPSLTSLDYLIYQLTTVGFLLLTASIMLGAFWSERVFGIYWRWDPKETWTFVTWLIYAIYLHARLMSGWQGRRVTLFYLAGFISIIFNYVIVRYLFFSGANPFH